MQPPPKKFGRRKVAAVFGFGEDSMEGGRPEWLEVVFGHDGARFAPGESLKLTESSGPVIASISRSW